MSRGVWFVAGAGVGVYAMTRARRLAEAFTPDGMRDRIGAAVVGVRMVAEEVSTGRAEAEPMARERWGLAPTAAPRLEQSRVIPTARPSPDGSSATNAETKEDET